MRKVITAVAVAALTMVFFTLQAQAATFDVIRTVDSAGDVGEYTSLVLNSSGHPVISHYNLTNGDLKLAVCDDPACSSAVGNAPTITTAHAQSTLAAGTINALGVCDWGTGVRISGGGRIADIDGGIYSNGSIFLQAGSSGNPGTYETPARYGGLNPDGTFSGETFEFANVVFDGTSPLPDGTLDIEPVVRGSLGDPHGYMLTHFGPGSYYAAEATINRAYHAFLTDYDDSGNVVETGGELFAQFAANYEGRDLPAGLYYIEGDVVTTAGVQGNVTLVVDGVVDISGGIDITAYSGDMALFIAGGDGTCSGGGNISYLSGSQIAINGTVYAPHSAIRMSVAGGFIHIYGDVTASFVGIQGAEILIGPEAPATPTPGTGWRLPTLISPPGTFITE